MTIMCENASGLAEFLNTMVSSFGKSRPYLGLTPNYQEILWTHSTSMKNKGM